VSLRSGAATQGGGPREESRGHLAPVAEPPPKARDGGRDLRSDRIPYSDAVGKTTRDLTQNVRADYNWKEVMLKR